MTDDLTTWLRQQFDDEWRALDELDDPQRFPASVWWKPSTDGTPEECLSVETYGPKAYRQWWSPRRTGDLVESSWSVHASARRLFSVEEIQRRRADIDAKRRIVDAYEGAIESYGYVRFGEWESCSDDCPEIVLGEVVKLLALPYADRPGWQPEWVAPPVEIRPIPKSASTEGSS